MFGLNLQVLGTIARPVLALFKELLFGKYRIADYFRNHKLVLLSIVVIGVMSGLFLNMTENALISVQHVRNLTQQHKTEMAKVNAKLKAAESKRDEYERRMHFICTSVQSEYCPKQPVGSPAVSKPELDLGEF